MTDRINPQFDMEKDAYNKFRQACGEIPVRRVIEELLKLTLDATSVGGGTVLNLAISRARLNLGTGKVRGRGRPTGRRDSVKREARSK